MGELLAAFTHLFLSVVYLRFVGRNSGTSFFCARARCFKTSKLRFVVFDLLVQLQNLSFSQCSFRSKAGFLTHNINDPRTRIRIFDIFDYGYHCLTFARFFNVGELRGDVVEFGVGLENISDIPPLAGVFNFVEGLGNIPAGLFVFLWNCFEHAA